MKSDARKSLNVLSSAPLSPYKPLSQDKDSTRLVRVKAAKADDDPIICNLFNVEFGEKPKFHALSYMWGDGQASCDILLNGAAFGVRQNLWDALRYLRTHAADTSYWIDAICINQDDLAERNRQVRIMHHIYFRADTVVVWLGKKYAEYEAGLPDLRKLVHCRPSNKEPKLEPSDDQSKSDLSAAQQPREDAQQRKLAEELYHDGYWNRLWIIQEIGRARNIKVCFGNSVLKWNLFIHFITHHNIGSQGPVRLDQQRQKRYTGSSTLLQLLEDHKEALCQDRKDKVYGLIGLASDATGFIIDYGKSLYEIWTDVMEFMNKHDLFADKDIVEVGGLVKSMLMDANCLPLKQVLRQYAPDTEDTTIITGPQDFKAFELQAAMLGCVIFVGPRPHEIVGNLNKVDKWTEQVQSNYKNDLGHAHRESDSLVSAVLDLGDSILSNKCFDCRSIIQWSVRSDNYRLEVIHNNHSWISELQIGSSGQLQNENISTEQFSSDHLRLFQMWDRRKGQAPCKMGLASGNIRCGDLICWLRSPRRAVVVRPRQLAISSNVWELQVVGTAVVTEDLREQDLSCSQRVEWDKNRLKLTIYLDAATIFILLA
ncbi:heterokaryon incompatibility protein-domain-containing protein [Stachybotrys elegans]|uniref:Heterokaryon incompatibility protein-domain-containing protein n=1 Tax=Stachybotrys elegans TaxID=80388 RepID=A0A8K0SNX1_9HYPO|nr:heterokaryon incompatibility protein-domain-containing protein [Stachybotrys elegans]